MQNYYNYLSIKEKEITLYSKTVFYYTASLYKATN